MISPYVFLAVSEQDERIIDRLVARQHSGDPTAYLDHVAMEMREHYESNKPRWWQKKRKSTDVVSDDLMLGLAMIVISAFGVKR